MKKEEILKLSKVQHASEQSDYLTPTRIAQRKINQTERECRVTQICTNIARHVLRALSPRLKPKHSATKMFAASEIAANLTVFRCSKIAACLLDQSRYSKISANLTVFCCCKFNSNAASKIAALTAFAVAKLLLHVTYRFCWSKIAANLTVFDAANLLLI